MLNPLLNFLVRVLFIVPAEDDFEVDAVVERVTRATGLSDFGEDDWQTPLALLLLGYREEADLSPLGRTIAMRLITGLLQNRLRTQAALSQIAEPQEIRAPVFILGLPRTGSTLLHELLAAHEGFRAPLFWEADALPDGTGSDPRRVLLSRARIALLHMVAPRFKTIHPIGAKRPHECVSIQALALRSMQLHAIHEITSYTEWLAGCDWAPAYRWHARYLGLLQGLDTGARRRWLLKAPGHMHGIEALLARYPDATFVQLHRDPKETMPSMASLYYTLRAACSPTASRRRVGELVVREWSEALTRLLRARSDPEVDRRFLDVQYGDLTGDPLASAERICAFLGEPVSAESAKNMRAYLAANNGPGRHTHSYKLADFDLTNEVVDAAFADYRARFGP